MEKKLYKEFLELFLFLDEASSFIPIYQEREILKAQGIEELSQSVTTFFEENIKGRLGFGFLPDSDLFDEIKNDLLFRGNQQDKDGYLLSILNDFRESSLYLNIGIEKEYINFNGKSALKIGNTPFPKEYTFTHKLIERHLGWSDPSVDINTTTIPEGYIIQCFNAYSYFFRRLYDLCIEEFQIDLIALQNKFSLQIFVRDLPYFKRSSNLPDRDEIIDEETPGNPLIFNVAFINNFFLTFNDFLWEITDIETCKNWFRVNPIGKPEFKDDLTTYFCYAIGQIEDKIIAEYRPKNINKWISTTINGNNYSGLKSRAKNKIMISEIDEKLSLIK